MSMFNRRKKNQDAATEQASSAKMSKADKKAAKEAAKAEKQSQKVSKSQPKRKKGDTMAAVLHESVLETVLEEFSGNPTLVAKKDGETVYIGLYLDTADIGGLTKKSAKDEAKGSIIECINAGNIKALLTPDLLDKEHIVLVPDAVTLDQMSEFGILMGAPYKYCYVQQDGEIEVTEQEANLDAVQNVVVHDGLLSSIVDGSDAPDYEEEEGFDDDIDEEGFEDEFEDDEDDFDPDPADVSHPDDDDMPFASDDDFDEDDDYDPDYGDDENYVPEEMDEEPVDETVGVEISDEALMQTMIRRFYSDDLGLEVSTEAFDVQFLHGNTYIPFLEDRGGGWLNDYMDQMSINFNLELRRMHQENLFKIRERYFNLIAESCGKITAELDTSDPTTKFGQMKRIIEDAKDEAKANEDQTIYQRREALKEEWETTLAEVGDNAARAAEQQHRDRFGRQHEADSRQVAVTVKNEIEDAYQDSLRTMHNERREMAKKMLDMYINEALKEVSEMYAELLEQENARYKEMQTTLDRYMDDNRKQDIARTETLQQELNQKEKADAVMAEYTEKLRKMNAEFDAKRMSLESDIQRMDRENERKIANMQENHAEAIQSVRKERDKQEDRLDNLIEQIGNMDSNMRSEWQVKFDELRAERDSWEEKCEYVISVQKRSNIVMVAICVVAVVAALCIGFIGGSRVQLNDMTKQVPVQQVQVMEQGTSVE